MSLKKNMFFCRTVIKVHWPQKINERIVISWPQGGCENIVFQQTSPTNIGANTGSGVCGPYYVRIGDCGNLLCVNVGRWMIVLVCADLTMYGSVIVVTYWSLGREIRKWDSEEKIGREIRKRNSEEKVGREIRKRHSEEQFGRDIRKSNSEETIGREIGREIRRPPSAALCAISAEVRSTGRHDCAVTCL